MAEMLQVWNMALGFVGTRMVSSTDENTQEAIQCKLFWDSARRQVLRDYAWNFARRRQWLARTTVPDTWEKEYAYAYVLPEDCLKPITVRDAGGCAALEYALAYDKSVQGQILLVNTPRALLTYTADVKQIEIFDDLCAHVLARLLASLIAAPLLRDNTSKINELEQLYRSIIPQAREANASEVPQCRDNDSWLQSRTEEVWV